MNVICWIFNIDLYERQSANELRKWLALDALANVCKGGDCGGMDKQCKSIAMAEQVMCANSGIYHLQRNTKEDETK